MSDRDNEIDESSAPLLDHLIELRNRLLWCMIGFAAAFGLCFYFATEIFEFLVRPLQEAFADGEGRLIYTQLYEAFFVEIKVAMFGAFVIAFPLIAMQIWAFVAPGLYKNEKRAFLPFLIATPILFTAGAALAYYVVMPTAFRFFLAYQGDVAGLDQEALPAIGDYLSLVMRFILIFGIAFLLPVLLLLLNRAGLVDRQQLVKARRYIIVLVFIIAAVFTPPDPITQLMLAVPLCLLFEITLLIIWFTDRKRRKSQSA
ncbi:twin-arginine translocase subunit TatC [Parasphingopyxis marina]|uniref:Sec-independent protein translocase protein TatC n=1 Tax=Parasphingopyxis marina TaxID=2761622 RepID=A0A842HSZ0_9SPHN|nr:twin-arginine translocase subunit TatC [Parasphingopyxis marina]MBC2776978.1 twin-arginine translocase subunit TatC [Parasphingopyxis marina]